MNSVTQSVTQSLILPQLGHFTATILFGSLDEAITRTAYTHRQRPASKLFVAVKCLDVLQHGRNALSASTTAAEIALLRPLGIQPEPQIAQFHLLPPDGPPSPLI